jgi:membrane protein YqaA with SNARE-associated domain
MPESEVSQPQTPESVFHPWIFWLGLLWGFAEATLFFIVPDVLLTLIALFSFRQSARVLACILIGALGGGIVMFCYGEKDPPQAKALVLQVPFVSPAMFVKTQQGFERDGIWTLVRSPGNGIPYKIYCVQASRYSRWPLFLLVCAVARMERFAPFWLLASSLGLAFRARIRRRPMVPTAMHVCLWILGYAWYWSAI